MANTAAWQRFGDFFTDMNIFEELLADELAHTLPLFFVLAG